MVVNDNYDLKKEAHLHVQNYKCTPYYINILLYTHLLNFIVKILKEYNKIEHVRLFTNKKSILKVMHN